jgi:hypothetical protein
MGMCLQGRWLIRCSHSIHAKLGTVAHLPIIFGGLFAEFCLFFLLHNSSSVAEEFVKREVARDPPTFALLDSPDSTLQTPVSSILIF